MRAHNYESRLLERTLDLLQNRPRSLTLEAIATETGLTRPFLASLLAGQTNDPGVARVETLYRFLSGKQLDL